MKLDHVIYAIPLTISAILIVDLIKETENVTLPFVYYALIVAGAVCIFAKQRKSELDEKITSVSCSY